MSNLAKYIHFTILQLRGAVLNNTIFITQRNSMSHNTFQDLFKTCYYHLNQVLLEYLDNQQYIIDIGTGRGYLPLLVIDNFRYCRVDAIDHDKEALCYLQEKLNIIQHTNNIYPIHIDANKYLEQCTQKVDLIVLQATLHEINTPEHQQKYLDRFFARCDHLLNSDGKLIIGDYYYPTDMSDAEVQQYITYQQQTINHADSREKFINIEQILQVAAQKNYTVLYKVDMRAVQEIDRRYYIIVLQKK